VDQIYGRRLAIRSCYSDNEKTLGWIPIQKICDLTIQSLSSLIDETVLQDVIDLIVEDDFFYESFEHFLSFAIHKNFFMHRL